MKFSLGHRSKSVDTNQKNYTHLVVYNYTVYKTCRNTGDAVMVGIIYGVLEKGDGSIIRRKIQRETALASSFLVRSKNVTTSLCSISYRVAFLLVQLPFSKQNTTVIRTGGQDNTVLFQHNRYCPSVNTTQKDTTKDQQRSAFELRYNYRIVSLSCPGRYCPVFYILPVCTLQVWVVRTFLFGLFYNRNIINKHYIVKI